MTCSNCKTETSSKRNFCGHCGKRLKQRVRKSSRSASSNFSLQAGDSPLGSAQLKSQRGSRKSSSENASKRGKNSGKTSASASEKRFEIKTYATPAAFAALCFPPIGIAALAFAIKTRRALEAKKINYAAETSHKAALLTGIAFLAAALFGIGMLIFATSGHGMGIIQTSNF